MPAPVYYTNDPGRKKKSKWDLIYGPREPTALEYINSLSEVEISEHHSWCCVMRNERYKGIPSTLTPHQLRGARYYSNHRINLINIKRYGSSEEERVVKLAANAANKARLKSKRRVARDMLAGPKPEECPICLTPAAPTGVRKLVWDHDHQNGHFRGWVCCTCNRALGLFADDPDALTRAANYLRMDRVKNPPKLWKA